MNEPLDFLAIGDITNDEFIELAEATVTCDPDGKACILSMKFGEKIPYLSSEMVYGVGNSPNAAVCASRLGLKSGLMSHTGDDGGGQKCYQQMEGDHVSTDFMTIEDGKETNHHYVLRYQAERTILIKHTVFDYNLAKQIEGKETPKWIYMSSVGSNSVPYHHDLARWVKSKGIKMAFQPGTFQIRLGYEELKDIYESTEIFFCNVEEAYMILDPVVGANYSSKMKIADLLRELRHLGPKIVCITNGPEGAYAYDGYKAWYIPQYKDPKPPVSRTGAGDAFSATFTSAIMLGKSIDEALRWGPINSMSVVQQVGAQKGLLSRDALIELLNKAPHDYVPTQIAM